jgi:hypothetical protein
VLWKGLEKIRHAKSDAVVVVSDPLKVEFHV